MTVNFTIKFDSRSKEVILDCLKKELSIAEGEIRDGDYSEAALIRHEELLQIIRGVLYSRPEGEEVLKTEPPANARIVDPKQIRELYMKAKANE